MKHVPASHICLLEAMPCFFFPIQTWGDEQLRTFRQLINNQPGNMHWCWNIAQTASRCSNN